MNLKTRLYSNMEIDKIYNCDCVDGMQKLDAESIDLVVTSPPYDKLRNYNGIGKTWNHTKFMSVANELFRIMKNGGVVVWNVNDQTEKGSKTGTSFRQALFFMEIGFNLNDVMIWQKTNPLPQVRQPRYNACYEFMFVFSKGKPKTFNPIMRKTKYGGQEYHSTAKNIGGENGRRNLDTIINNESVDYNIWQIAVAQNKTGHPAVFPIQIPIRHIRSWSNENDIVLDPFIGSGTTAIAAIKEKRHYIGMELNKEYYDIACERIKKEQAEIKNSLFNI